MSNKSLRNKTSGMVCGRLTNFCIELLDCAKNLKFPSSFRLSGHLCSPATFSRKQPGHKFVNVMRRSLLLAPVSHGQLPIMWSVPGLFFAMQYEEDGGLSFFSFQADSHLQDAQYQATCVGLSDLLFRRLLRVLRAFSPTSSVGSGAVGSSRSTRVISTLGKRSVFCSWP